jgi:hypothetical protein
VTIEEAQAKLPEIIDKLTHRPLTSWPCQPASARNKSHWMAEDFDAPLEDFKEYMP